MGRPKESLPFGDTPLLCRIATTLLAATQPVIVIRREADQELPALPAGVATIHDEQPATGPLAAIATGLRHVQANHGFGADDAALVCACDNPFLRTADVEWLVHQLGHHDLVMPAPEGIMQPLCAIYRVKALAHADALLAAGTRTPRTLATDSTAARVLDDAELRAHDPELRFLRNVNTPADYRRALADDAY